MNRDVVQFFKGTFANGVSALLLKILGIFCGILVAREFGMEGYGLFALYISTFVLFGTTLSNTFYVVAAREGALALKSGDKDKITFIAVEFIIVVLFFSCLIWLVLELSDLAGLSVLKGEFINLFQFFILIVMIILHAPIYGLMNALSNYEALTKTSLFAFSVSLCFLFFISINFYGMEYYLYAYVLVYVLTMLGIYYVFFKTYKINLIEVILGINLKRCRRFIKSVGLLYVAAFFSPLAFWILYNFLSTGADGPLLIGGFMSIMQWVFIFSQFSLIINNVVIPKLIKPTAMHGKDRIEAISFFFGWAVISYVSSILIIFPEIHASIFGSEFSNPEIFGSLQVVLLVSVISGYKGFISRNIISSNRNWISLVSNSLWFVVFMAFIFLLDIDNVFILSIFYLLAAILSFLILIPVFIKYKLMNLHLTWSISSLLISILPVLSMLAYFHLESLFERGLFLSLLYLIGLMVFMYDSKFTIFNKKEHEV